ncbi:SGNH/GDSL hydrolase family protein [Brotaphodocola catenula]|uniref:SGNH/GDSL hydrolase family protein n=1 Tax=Brotaphodocola catenula TaxID=2885361 RepID=A0AAE3DL24_9FIRM|nr:SGNH/GDSL hydrolase family protein [Brotaphodocola catenula]MCC2165812.1 SGNH/GDSL hydrolase family protein [Brotaphodocola catenula]
MVFLWIDQINEKKKSLEIRALSESISQQEKEAQELLENKKLEDSFYQKLEDNFAVNVLIVGDSIGTGAGIETDGQQWFTQLQSYLRKINKNSVSLTNVSMGGNTSYAGYVRTEMLDDDINYDLAIICYGQNDSLDDFSTYYESIIRSIKNKYPDCSIISILESSQREYSEKMTMIQSICEHYHIPVADTIAAFNNSGKDYDDLTNDGIHPNDAGQKIYFETVKTIIDNNIATTTGKMEHVDIINNDVNKFDNFVWYGSDTDFDRIDDTTFIMNPSLSISGVLGIDYTYESGDNKADIYIDGKLYKSPTVTFNYDSSQRHIMVVSDDCTVEKQIKIVFNSKEQANGFYGICFSWK